jgi:hypothetical protein
LGSWECACFDSQTGHINAYVLLEFQRINKQKAAKRNVDYFQRVCDASGNGYFMGEFIGLYAEVKDSRRFPDEPGNWAFFSFTTAPGKAPKRKAEALPTASCNTCHRAGAEEYVFSQYYPILREAKPK